MYPLGSTVLAILAAAALLGAQSESPPVTPGQVGFNINGAAGTAGDICSGFQCAARDLGVTRGEALRFVVRSQQKSRWLLLAGPQPLTSCVSVPGIGNRWAGPFVVVGSGTLMQYDPLRCFGALGGAVVTVPASGLHIGATAAFQVVVENYGVPVFSSPVTVTVRK